MKWALELEEFKVVNRPRTAIKGQALVDFLIEFTYPKDVEEMKPVSLPPNLQIVVPTWVLYIDRSSNN